MATYNIGYIICNAAGMMMGSLVFGLIKDSIVIKRIKDEQKKLAKKKEDKQEALKKRKSTLFMSGAKKTVDTDRDFLD